MADSRICALISWYDEQPTWLAAAIGSLAGVVDHVVAVDGAYALYPTGRNNSPLEQQLAVVEAAAAARVGLTLHVPPTTWAGNEVEKRNATLQIAHATVATDASWWLLAIDADERVIASDHLTGRLDQLDDEIAVCAHAFREGDSTMRRRALFRADPTLRYEGSHYVVRNDCGYLTGALAEELLPGETLIDGDLLVEHRPAGGRSAERRAAKDTYYRVRDALGVEAMTTRYAVEAQT